MNQLEKKDIRGSKKGSTNLTWKGKKLTSAHLLIISYTIILFFASILKIASL